MPVTNQGAQPAGFRAVFHVDPKPGTDGMIRGESPLTVEFDECGSRTDPDKTLTYLYDWNFDGVADAVGTGDSCRREHKYNVRRVAGVKGNVLFNTNVCVVSGNPRVHGPDTYFSCREFTVTLPVPKAPAPAAPGTLVGSYSVGTGANWETNPPTFSCIEACASLFGGSPAQYACSTVSSSVDNMASLSVWGVGGCLVQAEDYKVNTFYNCGSDGCAASAYVQDNCGAFLNPEVFNFCFLQ